MKPPKDIHTQTFILYKRVLAKSGQELTHTQMPFDVQTDNLTKLCINRLLWSCKACAAKKLPDFHFLPPVGGGFSMSRMGTCNMCKVG